jgi:hypothetical protein
VSKTSLPSGEAAFLQLRDVARRAAGQDFAPGPTSSIVPASKPSPRSRASELEAPGSKTPEDPRLRPTPPTSSSGRERPARVPKKPMAEATPELEAEPDLHDLFFPVRRK